MNWLVWLLMVAAVAVLLALGHMAGASLDKALDEAERQIEEQSGD